MSEEDEKLQAMVDKFERYVDQSREATFENEKFVIGVLQVVAGGSLVAVIAQIQPLTELASVLAVYWFMTLAAASLALAVLAAYFKHQYKLWDLKMHAVSEPLKNFDEVRRRQNKSQTYLRWMRWAIGLCVATTILSFAVLCGAFWWRHLVRVA